ncbi:MAG: energy-coupling factor transporter ATPase [Eubacterium sp.]|nr:energy-coupling factor transporter ATPase [Eubacterium sp.]
MDILLNKVSYIYDEGTSYEKCALAGVDLEVVQGEFIGLIGRTGSGKSTLVRLFNGLLKPTYGGVYVDGQDIADPDYSLSKLRGRVGLVFQYPEQQLFESTVIADVQFGPNNQGLDKLTCEMRAYQALKTVGIGEELIDVPPLQLSGGQKRRVAIAGVLAMQPEVLILDEPTAGLDPGGREDIFSLLHTLNEKNITIILISHSMEDVAEHTSRVIVMNDGRIAMDGATEDVFTRYDELLGNGLKIPVASRVMAALEERGSIPAGQHKSVIRKDQIVELIRRTNKGDQL